MKILVAIANYGTANDRYLSRILAEFRAMPYDVDLVVTSNLSKAIGDDVEVRVGLPTRDPRSLPFAHKQIFADRRESHDLFIYTEDDILITSRNVSAFLRVTDVLPEDQLAGFIRSETDPQGGIHFPDVHFHFHWDAGSVTRIGEHIFAHFTNPHSGCYALTKRQLKQAIASGGFLVPPHGCARQLLETAATDPYTQCGFRKMICVSHIEEFIVPHLSNRYVREPLRGGELSAPASDFYAQVRALSSLSKKGNPRSMLFPVENKVLHRRWSKSYYECCQADAIALIPKGVKTVLSVGCGWGLTEERLMQQGMKVTAVPIDAVIAASAKARGIDVVSENDHDLYGLTGCRFDCLLFLNVLHLVRDPVKFLDFFRPLCPDGCVVASVPNLSKLRRLVRWIQFRGHDANPRSYQVHGMHRTTGKLLRQWFRLAGLRPAKVGYEISKNQEVANRRSLGLARPILAETCSILAFAVSLESSKQHLLVRPAVPAGDSANCCVEDPGTDKCGVPMASGSNDPANRLGA